MTGKHIQADKNITAQTAGTELLAAAASTQRYFITDLHITGKIAATSVITIYSATHTLVTYTAVYGHPCLHFAGDGFELEKGEGLTVKEETADCVITITVVGKLVG